MLSRCIKDEEVISFRSTYQVWWPNFTSLGRTRDIEVGYLVFDVSSSDYLAALGHLPKAIAQLVEMY